MSEPLPLPPPPSPDWAWFLDVDGSLIDIAATPSAILVPDGLAERLAALSARYDGAVALVSGRSIDNLRRLFDPFRPPAAGLHGLERVTADGRVIRPRQTAGLDDIRARLMAFAGAYDGLALEDKGLTLALHYRQAPDRQQEARRAVDLAVAAHPGFRVMAGKMVFEVEPAGYDKGKAVVDFMAEPPFTGRVPVFVGDDVTDEWGFRAAEALGGVSVLVGPPRATAARFGLDDPAACRAWLDSAP